MNELVETVVVVPMIALAMIWFFYWLLYPIFGPKRRPAHRRTTVKRRS
jgi:hypothetical protein